MITKLEDLVLPFEKCKRLPSGLFKDSVLVWVVDPDGLEMVLERELAEMEYEELIPAPTLKELLLELEEVPSVFDPKCVILSGEHIYQAGSSDDSVRYTQFEPEDAVLDMLLERLEENNEQLLGL